jgi:hypothetical protein
MLTAADPCRRLRVELDLSSSPRLRYDPRNG